jgi:hypothetical protein
MSQSKAGAAGQTGNFCWGALVAGALHPVAVQIIEALQWIGRPLSAVDLVQLFDGSPSPAVVGRHMRRLSKLNAIEIVRATGMLDATQIAYRLVTKGEGDGG